MTDTTISFTIKSELVSDVVSSLCDTYGQPIDGQTNAQRAKEIVRNFVRECYVNWASQQANIIENPIAKIKADSDIN